MWSKTGRVLEMKTKINNPEINKKQNPLLTKEGCPQDGVVLKPKQINNLPKYKLFRKSLRKNLTSAEAVLWKMLQKRKLCNRKFRRQHSIGKYILDFYCPDEKLAVELDGQGHFEMAHSEYDVERSCFLNSKGIKVLRFENKVVFEFPGLVLEEIKNNFNHPALKRTPPKTGGDSE